MNTQKVPMQPKRQRHFRSLKEIESEIDKAKRRVIRFRSICETRQKALDEIIKARNPDDPATMREGTVRQLEDNIRYMERQIYRLENTRLPKLKRLHAAFQTAILPGVEHDGSVVLEKL